MWLLHSDYSGERFYGGSPPLQHTRRPGTGADQLLDHGTDSLPRAAQKDTAAAGHGGK